MDRNNIVLVVDHDPVASEYIQTVLESTFGVLAVPAQDGKDALRKARQMKPALVLLDIEAPQEDGLEVARQLQSHPATKAIPIVAVTAFDTAYEEAMNAGCADYILKPFDVRHFAGKVHRYLSSPTW